MERLQGRKLLVSHLPLQLILVGVLPKKRSSVHYIASNVKVDSVQSDEGWSIAVTMSRKSKQKCLKAASNSDTTPCKLKIDVREHTQLCPTKRRAAFSSCLVDIYFSILPYMFVAMVTFLCVSCFSLHWISRFLVRLWPVHEPTEAIQGCDSRNVSLVHLTVEMRSDGMLLPWLCESVAELECPILCKNSFINRTSRCYLWLRAGA